MGMLRSSESMCPSHCSEWARKYMNYCLCDFKGGASLALGMVSVISWGVAEIPQIITNYKQKSAEGLSIAFLMTWILGDFFNVFGCMLEPATLPTQFYMAILYTVTTLVLSGQAIYYSHIYHRLKSNGYGQKTKEVEKKRPCISDVVKKQDNKVDGGGNGNSPFGSEVLPSSPIPLRALHNSLPDKESYYISARSLSRSHTPAAGSFLAQRRSMSAYQRNSLEDPLLGGDAATQSMPPSNTKTMLCVFSSVTFVLGSLNLHLTGSSRPYMAYEKPNQGVVIRVGRKLLQGSGSLLQESGGVGGSGIGTFLGWGMAAIYMGGRLPQICLNIRRGKVEGLNPLMFIFALIGNTTYVASILVDSMDWSKISANLPWLVESTGCALLDTFIIIQSIYYQYRTPQAAEAKHQNSHPFLGDDKA